MRKVIFLVILLFGFCAQAGGLQASFTGVPNSPCDVVADQYSIGCWDGETDGSGNLVDKSGSNLLVQSEDFGTTWTSTRASISANAIENPVDGELTADALVEDGTAGNNHFVQQGSISLVSGTTYTVSIYARPELRTWLAFFVTTEGSTQYCDIQNCATGNTASAFSPTAVRVNSEWCRCSMSFTATATASRSLQIYAAEGNGDITLDGLSTTSLYLFGAQVREQRNVVHTNPGRYIATVAANKPWHDLAPNNGPTYIQGDLQRQDGSRITGREFDGTNQFYDKASHDSFGIFDGDHTVTFSLELDSGAAANNMFFSRGNFQTDGVYCYANVTSDDWLCSYQNSGASAVVGETTLDTNDDRIHIFQLVRDSNIATVYMDGTSGTPVDISTYGIDAARSLRVGRNEGGNYWDGNIFFGHVQRRALTPDELASQRENLWGILSNKKTLGLTNVIADGTMENAGVGDWSVGNSALLEKIPSPVHQDKQALKISRNGSNNPFAYQDGILTVGETYYVTGFVACDGNATPRVYVGSTTGSWTGTSSTDWQEFSFISRAMTTRVTLQSLTSTGTQFCIFDDVHVLEYDDSIWTFSRTTNAFMTYSTGTISEVSANIPRVGGKGGGIEIEGQSTNELEFSHDFTSWSAIIRSSVPSCNNPSPELGNDRACVLREDATAANNHYIADSAVFTATSGESYTFSVYAKEINRPWVYIYLFGAGVLNEGVYFNLSNGTIGTGVGGPDSSFIEALDNGWYRIAFTATATGTGTATPFIYVADADGSNSFNGANQDSYYIYGAQVEELTFPSSLVDTGGAGPVTRTADAMTIDPHPANSNNWILPETICSTCAAKDITIEFDMKCRWSGSSDIPRQYSILEVSGNSGTASATRNRIVIYVSSTGRFNGWLRDDSDADHYASSAADPVDFSVWNTYKIYFDTSDLSRLYTSINGSDPTNTYTGNSGTATFDTTNTLIRLFQTNAGVKDGFCNIENARINNKEF
jgi:hypothetical protein